MRQDLKPVITIIHSLPGRIRMRLSHDLKDLDKMKETVQDHAGLEAFSYTPVTRSILVRFRPADIRREEIVLRVALSVSLDYGAVPVRVLAEPEREVITDTGVYAAISLLTAYALRSIAPRKQITQLLRWIAGSGTALAVLEHGWREVRERGYFDPEVLSLGYLFTAFTRRNLLNASAVTWLLTFGRHLMEVPRSGIEVRPIRGEDEASGEPDYQVVVGPDSALPDRMKIARALTGLLKYAMTGGGSRGRGHLLEDLRDVSRVHGEVLEGMGWMPHGIPMRFR
jgi:hypothetical protein